MRITPKKNRVSSSLFAFHKYEIGRLSRRERLKHRSRRTPSTILFIGAGERDIQIRSDKIPISQKFSNQKGFKKLIAGTHTERESDILKGGRKSVAEVDFNREKLLCNRRRGKVEGKIRILSASPFWDQIRREKPTRDCNLTNFR